MTSIYTRRWCQVLVPIVVGLFVAGLIAMPLVESTVRVLLVVALTCPPAVSQLRRWLRSQRADRPQPHRLSDAQLCCAWRTTSMALRARTAPHEQLAIAAWREEYLDELERRNAVGFRAWIESGACADEALEGFFVRGGSAGT